MVLVWITTEVSAFCQYSDLVVMVLVTLQLAITKLVMMTAIIKIRFMVLLLFIVIRVPTGR